MQVHSSSQVNTWQQVDSSRWLLIPMAAVALEARTPHIIQVCQMTPVVSCRFGKYYPINELAIWVTGFVGGYNQQTTQQGYGQQQQQSGTGQQQNYTANSNQQPQSYSAGTFISPCFLDLIFGVFTGQSFIFSHLFVMYYREYWWIRAVEWRGPR